MCGLARTTGGPESTFVLLGGDICHFPGTFRPSADQRLPETIPSKALDNDAYFPVPCPGSLFTDIHPVMTGGKPADPLSFDPRASPFYRISNHETAAYMDTKVSQCSVDKLIAFDSSPSVLICLSHDETVLHGIPTLNASPNDDLNSWQKRGFKKQILWGWLNDLPRNGRPGRQPAVEGFWRDKKPWMEAKEILQKNGSQASSSGL